LNASVVDNPALKVFVPGLKRMDSVYIQSHFTNASWNAAINAAYIDVNGSQVTGLHIDAGTGINALNLKGTLAHLSSGSTIELNNTTITAAIANNKIDFSLNSKDNRNRDKYHIEGLFQQPQTNRYEFSISPDSLLLNYESWSVTPNNQIIISNNGIHASNFMLSQGAQQLTVTSVTASMNAPLRLEFANFQLATLTGFVQTDSTLANGTMNGEVVVNDISKPLFTSDLTVSNLALRGDTVGDVHAIVSNRDANTYTANIALSGRGNDAKLTGNYYVNGNNNFDFALAVNTLPMATLQAFSKGKLRGATGTVNGNFIVKGNASQPLINGKLNFNKAGFNFSMLNSFFSIDNEQLVINEQGIRFDQFQIRDSANNPLTINGMAATRNFMNYDFDLDVRADNFRALNSTKRDNKLFYGQLYFNTNLKIKGTEAAPAIDGRLVINEKTKMTVVIPQVEPGVVERDGIVEFIDIDAPLNDSLFLAAYDSLNVSKFTGMDIAVNIEIVPQAEFNLVIDEGNGDFLNIKGEAALTAGIDPSGKINLTGSYELEQGSYELTFNFLRRKFDIEKGSRITWNGEPTDATLDVRAVYVANASPLDLVSNLLGEGTTAFQRNTYLQKLPFDVHLDMTGDLMKPDINFDIVLPTTKSYSVSGDILTNVRTRLDQLRQEEGEMNKQVFSLLLLNRFIGDNPFNSSGGGLTPNVGALARQSVSKLLTEQLNRLAGDLVAGVNLNFDVTSTEDYTTGQRKDLTNLNVGLSKQLLNDRLTVTVGSNFELEGPQGAQRQTSNIAGNVALDYRLSKDNRYLLRAYRKNEYQGIIEGYVIETGVGFIINVDYNRFREIFMSKKDREQRRLRREKQREIDKQQAADSTSVKPPTPVN
jgi:translocation and assembly module TamB